jgi:hypothetical protein
MQYLVDHQPVVVGLLYKLLIRFVQPTAKKWIYKTGCLAVLAPAIIA